MGGGVVEFWNVSSWLLSHHCLSLIDVFTWENVLLVKSFRLRTKICMYKYCLKCYAWWKKEYETVALYGCRWKSSLMLEPLEVLLSILYAGRATPEVTTRGKTKSHWQTALSSFANLKRNIQLQCKKHRNANPLPNPLLGQIRRPKLLKRQKKKPMRYVMLNVVKYLDVGLI